MANSKDISDKEDLRQSIDGGVTAQPTSRPMTTPTGDVDGMALRESDYGDMNEEDARESGYIGRDGKAVDQAKREESQDSPTGALTDIGSGRSSVIQKH